MKHFSTRLAALLLSLLLMLTPALAQPAQIEGEIELNSDVLLQLFALDPALVSALNGELEAVLSAEGLHAQWESGMTFTAQLPGDGTLRFATNDMQQNNLSCVIPALPLSNPLHRIHTWMDQLDGEKSYANAVYSSLFTRALSVDLTGQMLSPILGEIVAQYPYLLSLLGLDNAAVTRLASSAQTGDVWGNITRYKGDAQQYPDLSLLVISLHLPALPHMYLWLRTDEFGSTIKFAMEEAAVTDWDETLLALEEGKSATGFIFSGFTLNFEDDEELNIYIEGTLTTADFALTMECNYYKDYTGDYLWAVEMEMSEAALGDVLEFEIEAEETTETVQIPDLSHLSTQML